MRDRPGDRDRGVAGNPSSFPETKPFETTATSTWILESILELQRSFGRVEKAVEGLEKSADKHESALSSLKTSVDDKFEKQRRSISALQKTVWTAVGGFGVVLLIVEHLHDIIGLLTRH